RRKSSVDFLAVYGKLPVIHAFYAVVHKQRLSNAPLDFGQGVGGGCAEQVGKLNPVIPRINGVGVAFSEQDQINGLFHCLLLVGVPADAPLFHIQLKRVAGVFLFCKSDQVNVAVCLWYHYGASTLSSTRYCCPP